MNESSAEYVPWRWKYREKPETDPEPGNFGKEYYAMIINPKAKYLNGVGFSTKQTGYRDICECGDEQIIICYKDLDESLTPEHFKYLCRRCPNAKHPSEFERSSYTLMELADNHSCSPHNAKAFVYFMSDGEYIKIGKATSPRNRLNGIQTGNPRKVEIIAMIPCESDKRAHDLERKLHWYYQEYRAAGEWFDIQDKLDVFRVASRYPPNLKGDNDE